MRESATRNPGGSLAGTGIERIAARPRLGRTPDADLPLSTSSAIFRQVEWLADGALQPQNADRDQRNALRVAAIFPSPGRVTDAVTSTPRRSRSKIAYCLIRIRLDIDLVLRCNRRTAPSIILVPRLATMSPRRGIETDWDCPFANGLTRKRSFRIPTGLVVSETPSGKPPRGSWPRDRSVECIV